jgi:predicted PurR-regulated permease PerM
MPQASQTDTGFGATAGQLAQQAPELLARVVRGIWSGGLVLVNFLALFLVTPIVAFYLLKDWDRLIAHLDDWTPRQHAPTVRRLGREMDEVISGFVRGQIIVLVLLSLMYVTGLILIGLNFGLLIGLGAGLISFVPYLGPLAGFLVGGIVAVVQFWPDWMPIAGVIGVFAAGQFIEGNILSPLIVGDKVHLHPVWLIFALFAFGYLFGFVGLLLAVPVAAALGVLVRFALHRYLRSPLYLDAGPGGPAAD